MIKSCNMCGQHKDIDNFHKRSASVDGYAHRCKECVSDYGRARYQSNKEHHSELNRQWRQNNKMRKAETDKKWKQANRERVHQMERNRLHVRRAKIQSAISDDSRLMRAEQVVFGYYGIVCMIPGCNVSDPSLDHIVPFALGGRHEFSNLQVLCRRHNLSKQHRESVDYRPVELLERDIDEIVEILKCL